MEETHYRIVITGINPGNSPQKVIGNLSRLFKTDPSKFQSLAKGGQITVSKKSDQKKTDVYKSTLGKVGCKVLVQPLPKGRNIPASLWRCPACSLSQTETVDQCPSCGIYAAKYKKIQLKNRLKDELNARMNNPEEFVDFYIPSEKIKASPEEVVEVLPLFKQEERFHLVSMLPDDFSKSVLKLMDNSAHTTETPVAPNQGRNRDNTESSKEGEPTAVSSKPPLGVVGQIIAVPLLLVGLACMWPLGVGGYMLLFKFTPIGSWPWSEIGWQLLIGFLFSLPAGGLIALGDWLGNFNLMEDS